MVKAWLLGLALSHSSVVVGDQDGLYKPESAVRTLTDKDLPGSDEKRFILVEYYSAWCGHCQRFAPEYEELATRARTELPSLQVGAINCPSYSDACAAVSVSSFPTLMLFPGKHMFKGDRNPSAILKWAASLSPGGEQLLSPEATAANDALAAADVHAGANISASAVRNNLLSQRPVATPVSSVTTRAWMKVACSLRRDVCTNDWSDTPCQLMREPPLARHAPVCSACIHCLPRVALVGRRCRRKT